MMMMTKTTTTITSNVSKSFLTFTGETHGNNICKNIGEVQIISINLGDIVNFFLFYEFQLPETFFYFH